MADNLAIIPMQASMVCHPVILCSASRFHDSYSCLGSDKEDMNVSISPDPHVIETFDLRAVPETSAGLTCCCRFLFHPLLADIKPTQGASNDKQV